MNAQLPSSSPADEHPDLSSANARSGLLLFFLYLAFYGGFVGLAAFAPEVMGRPLGDVNLPVAHGLVRRLLWLGGSLSGVNVAIAYGLALIFGALIIAALYMAACARNSRRHADRGSR